MNSANEQKFKYVFFDFDGTIADTYDYYFNKLAEMYPNFNLKNLSKEEIEGNRNKSFNTIVREQGIPMWKLLFMAWRVKNQLNKDILQINMFNGIKEIFSDIKNEGKGIAVVSNNNNTNVLKFLQKEKIENLVNNIWTTSAVNGKHKSLQKALKYLKLEPQEVLYVGDEVRDINACKSTGIPIAAVTWGFNSENILSQNNPEYLVHNMDELKTVISSNDH